MREIQGNLNGAGARFAIVASRFNGLIVQQLIAGARDGLVRHGVADDDITLVHVPGAYELPLACDRLAASGDYAAVIALGAVIRGATAHFDFVAGECSKGLAAVALTRRCPVVMGVLTTDTIEQALERAGTKAGNKGFDAAMTAIEMANLMPQLASRSNDGQTSA